MITYVNFTPKVIVSDTCYDNFFPKNPSSVVELSYLYDTYG